MLFEWDDEKDRVMSKKIQKNHSKDKPFDNSDIDFTKVDELTEEDIEERAKNDPDAPIVDPKKVKQVKPNTFNR